MHGSHSFALFERESSEWDMRIAITGGIAEGKSTVLAALGRMGYSTISSDQVAKDLFFLPDVQAQLSVIAGLPLPVEPVKLRESMTLDGAVRRAINRFMHPLVMDALDQSGARFHEIPLLVEACLFDRYDQVWVVTCGELEQARRLRERYGPDVDLDALLGWQLPTSAKLPFADRIVRTNVGLDRVHRELAEAVAALFGQ